jgi:hypothetical protein
VTSGPIGHLHDAHIDRLTLHAARSLRVNFIAVPWFKFVTLQ